MFGNIGLYMNFNLTVHVHLLVINDLNESTLLLERELKEKARQLRYIHIWTSQMMKEMRMTLNFWEDAAEKGEEDVVDSDEQTDRGIDMGRDEQERLALCGAGVTCMFYFNLVYG